MIRLISKFMTSKSSIINEVIRAVLNLLFFFFYEKILHAPKAPKAPKSLNAQKA